MAYISDSTPNAFFVDFTEPTGQPWTYSFTATSVDGYSQNYTLVSFYNQFSKRWYIRLMDYSGPIFTMPLIGSPTNKDFNLAEGYLKTKIVYRAATKRFEFSEG